MKQGWLKMVQRETFPQKSSQKLWHSFLSISTLRLWPTLFGKPFRQIPGDTTGALR